MAKAQLLDPDRTVIEMIAKSPDLRSEVERQLPFSLQFAAIEAEGPVKPVEAYLDLEGVRLRIARDLNNTIRPGHDETGRALSGLPPATLVSYVVCQSGNQKAKCYFDLGRRELLGVIQLS